MVISAFGGDGAGRVRWQGQSWAANQRERSIPPSPAAERAVVISGFGGHSAGRVRWQGQSWAADNLEPNQPLQAGSEVVVMGRAGTRLQVLGSRVEP